MIRWSSPGRMISGNICVAYKRWQVVGANTAVDSAAAASVMFPPYAMGSPPRRGRWWLSIGRQYIVLNGQMDL